MCGNEKPEGECTPVNTDHDDPEDHTIDDLYQTLRDLVSPKFRITIRDGKNQEPEVSITPDAYNNTHPWTNFQGFTIKDALTRAIGKMSHPEQDYHSVPSCISHQGTLWEASGESVYGEQHTRLFLKVQVPET